MPITYTVAPGCEFQYPADANSLGLVKNAGGVSKLSPEDRKKVKFKTVKAGQSCADMPTNLEIYVERGMVIKKDTTPASKKDVE